MDTADKVKQSKGKSDPKAAATNIEKCMAAVAKMEAEKPADDVIDAKEGVMLDGCGGAVLSVGELAVNMDCVVDVPKKKIEKEEVDDDGSGTIEYERFPKMMTHKILNEIY